MMTKSLVSWRCATLRHDYTMIISSLGAAPKDTRRIRLGNMAKASSWLQAEDHAVIDTVHVPENAIGMGRDAVIESYTSDKNIL